MPFGNEWRSSGRIFSQWLHQFYVDASFIGDFKMFTLHTCFSCTFVVIGQLISHNSDYAEYDSAFRDMLLGVWLSLSLLLPYRLGLRFTQKDSIVNKLSFLQSKISGQPIPSMWSPCLMSRASLKSVPINKMKGPLSRKVLIHLRVMVQLFFLDSFWDNF